MTDQQRQAIVIEARTWLNTPYHHRAAVKGVGADCAMFPLAVYQAVLHLPAIEIPPYPMQWMLNADRELYLESIAAVGGRETSELLPANFLAVKFGRTYSHAAIILCWPLVIHSINPRGVVLADATLDFELAERPRKVFEL